MVFEVGAWHYLWHCHGKLDDHFWMGHSEVLARIFWDSCEVVTLQGVASSKQLPWNQIWNASYGLASFMVGLCPAWMRGTTACKSCTKLNLILSVVGKVKNDNMHYILCVVTKTNIIRCALLYLYWSNKDKLLLVLLKFLLQCNTESETQQCALHNTMILQ